MKKIILPLLAAVGCGGISTSALAASGNWTSTTGGDWTDTAKWDPAAVPGGNGTAVNLNADFTTGSKTINLNADAIVGTMIFGDSNATGPSALTALTLSGANTLFFNNSGSNATLTWQGAATNKISSAIKLDDNLVVSGVNTTGGFQGAISSNSPGEKTIYINSYSVFSGSISDGTGVVGLNRVASTALFLSGDNTFSGGVNLNSTTAQLSLGHENALGTGTLSIGTGSSVIVNVTSSNAIAKNLSFGGGQLTGSGNLTIEAMTIRATGSIINRLGDTLITGPVYLSENATASRGLRRRQ